MNRLHCILQCRYKTTADDEQLLCVIIRQNSRGSRVFTPSLYLGYHRYTIQAPDFPENMENDNYTYLRGEEWMRDREILKFQTQGIVVFFETMLWGMAEGKPVEEPLEFKL